MSLEAQDSNLIKQCNKIGGFITEKQAKESRNIIEQNEWFHGKLRASEQENKAAANAISSMKKDIDSLANINDRQTNLIDFQNQRFNLTKISHDLEIEDLSNQIKFHKKETKRNYWTGFKTGTLVGAVGTLLIITIVN